jgi:hypothetical protein
MEWLGQNHAQTQEIRNMWSQIPGLAKEIEQNCQLILNKQGKCQPSSFNYESK